MKGVSWESLVARQVQLFEKRRQQSRDVREARPFVTISREFGCGAFALATLLAERLNKGLEDDQPKWIVYNRDLILKVAQESELSEPLFESLEDEVRGQITEYLDSLICGRPDQETLFRKVVRAMVSLAAQGRAILIGRGGALVTGHLEDGHHYRLVAPLEHRIKHVMKELGLSREEAEAKVEKVDRSRAKLIRQFLTKDVSDPLHYDAVINTSRMPLNEIVNMVADRLNVG